jgi:hypothetical protein
MKYFSSDQVIEEFYRNLLKDESSAMRVHIPRSDVFYIRRAYFEATGNWESLDRIERSMLKEGLLEARDCFEPNKVRDWEYDYRQYDEDYK